MLDMKRREFIALVGGGGLLLATKTRRARAQQPAMPVIGFLEIRSPEMIYRASARVSPGPQRDRLCRGRERNDRLPLGRADGTTAGAGGPAGSPAGRGDRHGRRLRHGTRGQRCNSDDPHRVRRLRRPGQAWSCHQPRAPGRQPDRYQLLGLELTAKRLELLREMLPGAARVAVLVNPANTANTQITLHEVAAAGRAMGLQIQIFNASTSREIDAAFAAFGRERPDAVFVGQDAFYNGRRLQLANWTSRRALPMTSGSRDICEVGGLMSYGRNIVDTYRQEGVYIGRILKGAKPADLPVEQSAKFELVINAQTARILGVEIPSTLLARADEVIE